MGRIRLILMEPQDKEGILHLEARLHLGRGKPLSLWYRVPSSAKGQVTGWADPFVIAMIFPIMQLGKPVHVEGRVAPSLLFNLSEFMTIWAVWRPERYRAVDITAEAEDEPPKQPEKGRAVMAFSGGLDSCFTAWRHRKALAGRRTQNLASGVFIHGLDIPLTRKASYEDLKRQNQLLLSSVGMNLIPVATNYREMLVGWGDSHAASLIAALALFQKEFDTGLLGASRPYYSTDPKIVWGSNAVSDPLLSSASFRVLYDGAQFSRLDKAALVARWPEALQYMHVCWANTEGHENCCRCEKCVRTILMFRLLGYGQPPCFGKILNEEDIQALKLHGEVSHRTLMDLVREAEKRGMSDAKWVLRLRELTSQKTWDRRLQNAARDAFLDRGFTGTLLRSALYRIRSAMKRGS